MNYLQRLFQSSEAGVSFILVLMLVAAVALIVIPIMYVSATGLRGTKASEQRFIERYSADAGVEDALWRIKHEAGFDRTVLQEYSRNFNELNTSITVSPAPVPPNPGAPDLQPQQSGGAMTGYKTVDRNLVEPCITLGCTEAFIYTLYIENYGTSTVNMFALGDCLPPGFVLTGVGVVDGFDDPPPPWGTLTRDDLLPADTSVDPPVSYFPPGEVTRIPVGELDDANKKHGVFLTIKKNDPDPLHPCLAVDGKDRWQVKWEFSSPQPNVFDRSRHPGGRAWVQLYVDGVDLTRGIYHNEMWWDASPESFTGEFTGPTSPVYARFPEWDITSTARGTQVNARATILKNLPDAPVTILSWQADDGTVSVPPPPPGSAPVANFAWSPFTGFAPLTVDFTDSSINGPTSWFWDFGDGTSPIEQTYQNPSHTYTLPGNYVVTLTATNGSGSDTAIQVVAVKATEMHIASINVARVPAGGPNWQAEATVQVVNQNGQPVSGATVTGSFNAPNTNAKSGSTSGGGVATVRSDKTKTPPAAGGWCFDVTGVTLAGATYNPADNVVTSACEAP